MRLHREMVQDKQEKQGDSIMLVKFDAQKVFKEAHKRKMIRADLQDIVGFMFTDVIERLNPFDDAVEIDITDRLIEGVAIKASTVRGISGKSKPKTNKADEV